MAHKVTLIPGDGIGPEVTGATVRILEASGVKFEWETFQAGAEAFEKYHEYIPKELTESIERTRVGLKGPVTTPVGGGFASINVQLRKQFELYANFRPISNLPHIPTRYPNVDLIIVRENTESLYSGLEHEVVPGVVESLKIITEKASTRIARFAFEYARKNKRKKIHAIHKANIMKLSDGLFLRCCRNVAKEYPEITYGEHIVDNTCMQLVMNPYQYDVLVMENLYGDIISDLCAAFVGGLGFVPAPTSAIAAPSLKRCTARPRTSPERTWPTRRPCCAPRCSCSAISESTTPRTEFKRAWKMSIAPESCLPATWAA